MKTMGWGLLILAVLLAGYFTGWVLLAAVLLGSGPIEEIPRILSILLIFAAVLAWLVARFVSSWRGVLRVIGMILGLQLVIGTILALVWPDRALYLARVVAWGDSNILDHEKFPARAVDNAPPAYPFDLNLSSELFQTVEYSSEGQVKQASFEEFLQSSQTTSFIVIKEDAILYEAYFNGYSRDSIVTSFSVAKSFTSALVGIAIDEGSIGGVDDLMIEYLPELKGQGFDELTIRHLLDMSSGIRFVPDDEVSLLGELTQFTDEGLTYTYPDLRSLALQIKPDGERPGTRFNYNNYHMLLLGMILERTTGRPPAEYLQEKIWKPLGMEYPASWSLDSDASGFELMVSGINARAIDFAKFGRLFLNNGDWNGDQIISEEWVNESTAPDPNDNRPWRYYVDWKEAGGYYKYLWWGMPRPDGSYDYMAQGHLGQFIFVSPQERVVIVRFGLSEGGVDSWAEVFQNVAAKARQAEEPPAVDASPAWDLRTSTPEEQGFDSGILAEGLQAIRKRGLAIHSLTIVRNDAIVLNAYFYPYDGTIYHDLASVTKSVLTTLVGIAADQGYLDLDQPVVAFFPGRTIANRDELKERITVRHLASMSSGLDCTYGNEEQTLQEMRASADWIQFFLDRPVVAEPGSRFVYCSPGMHLLSAVLQEATGMTALEFARQNLFEPLGIQEVYWPADPQGYNHGWGDLSLKPPDMARLGALFLHQGRWGDRQIISPEWVAEATARQISTLAFKDEDYGYGWWVSRDPTGPNFFRADGNGGQRILMVPDMDLVLATTGGGFSLDEIFPYVTAAVADSWKTLPANLEGAANLATALEDIRQGPAPKAVPPIPAMAGAISGQTFEFESGSFQIRSVQVDFDGSDEAIVQLDVVAEAIPRTMVVGLDGVYRPSVAGRPVLARGGWADETTFVIEINEGPGFHLYMLRLSFEDNQVVLGVLGRSIKGQRVEP